MRNTTGISESEIASQTLIVLRNTPGGFMSTSDLIAVLTDAFRPTGKDAEIIPSRHDTYFSQKVRNMISHKDSPGNIIYDGHAEHVDDGLRLTEGR